MPPSLPVVPPGLADEDRRKLETVLDDLMACRRIIDTALVADYSDDAERRPDWSPPRSVCWIDLALSCLPSPARGKPSPTAKPRKATAHANAAREKRQAPLRLEGGGDTR